MGCIKMKGEMIRYGNRGDLGLLKGHDTHISGEELGNALEQGRVLMAYEGQKFAAWLRYHLFWDQIPFMSMLFCMEGKRGQGYGGRLVDFWEGEMGRKGFGMVLTSTLSSEGAQHFHRKRGYVDCGSLLLPGEPLEIILRKELVSDYEGQA